MKWAAWRWIVGLVALGVLGLCGPVPSAAVSPATEPFLPLLFKGVSNWSPRSTVTPTATPTATATFTAIATATATATATSTVTPTPGVAILRITPAGQVVPLAGGTFTVSVDIAYVHDVGVFGFGLAYDQTVIDAVDVVLGPFLGSTGNAVISFGPAIGQGWVNFSALAQGAFPGPDGAGVLAVVSFEPVAAGATVLHLQNVTLNDMEGTPMLAGTIDGFVTVSE